MNSEPIQKLQGRISLIQSKLQNILLRISAIQSIYKFPQSQDSASDTNALEKYIAQFSEVQSNRLYRSSPKHLQFKHSRYYSFPEGNQSFIIKDSQNKQTKNLDSRSFGLIKRSIMLNSQEIQHIRQKMTQFQKTTIDKFLSIEEGISIMARVIKLIEGKIQTHPIYVAQLEKNQDHKKCQKQMQTDRILRKYQSNFRISQKDSIYQDIF